MRPSDPDPDARSVLRIAVWGFVAVAVLLILGRVMPLYVTITGPTPGPTPGLTPPACCAAPCPGHMSDGCPGASHAAP